MQVHKITENQRKYMAGRINEEFDTAVSFIKQKEAVTIQKVTDKAEKQYKKTLGIEKQVNRLAKAEKEFNAAKKECGEVVSAMETHQPVDSETKKQYNSDYYGGSYTIYSSEDMEKYVKMRCVSLALDNFGETPEGATMKKLEERRKRAVDYIYGLTKANGIAVGLNKILKGTSITLKLGE